MTPEFVWAMGGRLGITERSTLGIVINLAAADYILQEAGARRLQLDQLRARERYAQPVRSEVHEDNGLVLQADDATEAVLVMCHQVAHGESLDRILDYRDVEGTSGQMAPRGPGA